MCEGRGEVRGTWRGGAAVTMKMTRFQVHGSHVYSAYISSRSTTASQKCLALIYGKVYSQSPSISHPPEEQVSLPCCTVAFEYSCSPLVRSRTY